jgi:hypothetical protein
VVDEEAVSALLSPNEIAFAVTYDYRCPFARNACEHVLFGLRAGAPWAVEFWPFSLHQMHVEEGRPDVWEDPERAADLLAMQVGLAVRDEWPDSFEGVHLGVFEARHERGLDLNDEEVLRAVLDKEGLDANAVFDVVAGGGPLETLRREHESAARDHGVFGVPTFVVGEQAAFIRLMDRPNSDSHRAGSTIHRIIELVDEWPALNELKHTRIPR